MIISCPNLKDKKISTEFEELVKALDGDESAAYLIWSMNNGNSIDLAPNGEPSILFADLLAKYNGDRKSAIKDKAISFADNFVKTSEDANGEVLLKDLYTGIPEDNITFKIYSNNIKLSNKRKENVGKFIFGKLYPLRKVFSLNRMSPKNRELFLNDYKYYTDVDDIIRDEIRKEIEDIFLTAHIPYMEKGESLSSYIDRVIPYISDDLNGRIKFYSEYISDDNNKNTDYSSYFILSRIFKNRFIDFSKLEEKDRILLEWKYPKMFSGRFKSDKQAFTFYRNKWIHEDSLKMKNNLNKESLKYTQYKKALEYVQARYDFINMPTAKNWIRSKILNDVLIKYKTIISNEELNLLRLQKTILAETQGRAYTDRYLESLKNLPDNYKWLFDKGTDTEYRLSYLLANIVNKSSNKRYKILAKVLYEYFIKNDVSVTFTKIPSDNPLRRVDAHAVTNILHVNNDAIISDIYIEMDPDALTVTKEPDRVLLHETIHATSSFVIAAGLKNEINQIIDHILNHLLVFGMGRGIVATSINGLSSPLEFIADFYTAPEFQQMLKDIPPIPNTKFKNIFEHCVEIFKRAFFKLLGLSPNNLYDQLSPIMDDIISLQQDLDLMNPIIEQLKKYDKYGEFEADSAFDVFPEKHSSIKNILTLQLDQKSYVQSGVNLLLSSNPNATNEEVVDTMLNSEKEWANKQQERIIGETLKQLIDAFGLVKTKNGYEIPGDNSEIAKLRIQFINNMSNSGHIDTFRKAALDHYIISIGMENGDATTFNHELAHYYIRRFKDSKLVLSALDLYAKDGMSIDDIEEALVNAITERSVNNEFGQNLENQSFFHKFWYGFNATLYKMFNIKTSAARNSISDLITKAFLVNDTLDLTKNDIKYQLSYNRMYQSEFLKRRDKSRTNSYKAVVSDPFDVTAGKIIDTTRSRQKSYDLRMRNDKIGIFANEEQAVRNAEMSRRTQELSDKLKQAREAGDKALEKHILATLYLEFLRNAYKEAHELRVMMLNAEANQYRRVYYQLGEDGSKRYVRESDDNYLSEKNPESGMLSQEYIFDDLEYAKTDIIGYFTPIVQSIRSLTQSMEAEDYSVEDINAIILEFDNTGIEKILYDIERTYNDGLRKKVLDVIDDIVDSRTELDSDLKQRLRVNMYKWLNDQMDYGDVKAAEVWIGLGTRSKSPILRAVHDMLADMQDERDQLTYKKAIDLMDLKRKAEKHMGLKYKYFYNVQKLLVQLDKKGLPTGNWLSEINDGLYYIDRDEFRDLLLFSKKKGNWKYNTKSIEQLLKELKLSDGTPLIKDPDWRLEIDRLGAPIMPDHSLADEIYKNYMRDMETWISEHSDRPYTLKYYLDRIDYLSTPTLKAVNEVNAKINSITRTVIRNGKPRYELLTQNQMRVLSSYEAERKDLGNFYDADNQLKNKDSVEYKIAYDLMMWNRKTSDKIKYVTDFLLYEESKAAAKNPVIFERMFSHVSINPRLWEIIKLGRVENPARELDPRQKRLVNLQYQRSLLMSRYQGDRIGEVKWSELFNKETGRLNNINFWKNLQKLDKEINTLSNALNQDYPVEKDESQQGVYFSSVMSKLEIPYSEYPTGKTVWGLSNQETWRSYILNRLVQSMNNATDQNERNDILSEILLLSFYNIARSITVPVSIFSSYIPREEETIYNGEKIKDFVRTPVSLFAKIDKNKSSSEYVNKNYNESDDSSVLPKKSLYRDKRWDVINDPENKPLKDLYDALKKTMEQSFEMIPFSLKYDNRLSQMGARTGQILGRKFRTRFHKNLAEFLRREFSVVDTDYEFRANDDKEKRPDGSDIENIPVRFIKRLEKPQYINLDVVGSTIAFYDMALNYKIKAQHASELTAIFNRLEQNQLGGQYKHLFDAKLSEVLEGMLLRQLYEKQVTAGGNQNTGSDNLIGEKEWPTGLDWIRRSIGTGRDWLKRVGKLRIMFQTGMLALNATSAIVSFLDPLISLFIDSITGKYINYKDVGYAVGMLFRYSVQNFLSLGKIYSYGKAAAAMQRFLLSKSNMSTFRDTDQSLVMRFISDGLAMKYFTVGDYTINAINMIATMHNYRYYKDSTGNAKFYSKPLFILKVMQDKNCDVNLARSEYNSAQTMWNSCSVNDKGGFVANSDEYGNAIDSQTFTQLRKQIRSRSSLYNGIVPDIERTYLQTNILWSFVTLLRNFLITGVWERFLTYRDFLVSTFDESGNPVAREATSLEVKDAKRHQNYYKGGYSFATKQVENAVTWSAMYALSHMIPYIKYGYYLATHKGSMSKYDTRNQQYMKEHNLNQQDVYGLLKMFMECMAWMSLMLAYTFTLKAADEDENDYTKLLVNLLTLRLAIERYTWYSPQTAMELIQSPTTALADWKRKMMIFGLGADLVGLTGKDIQEPIKRGYYQHEPTWKYDVFNIFSHYGLHNWYKTMPEIMIGDINVGGGGARALKNTTNFYRSLRPEPVKWLQDAQEDSSTKQKRSKKSSNSNFESGFGSNFSSNFSSNFGSNF